MQVIAAGASCVKIRKFQDDGSVPKQRWFCKNCFADAKAIRTLAMSVDRTRTEKILELIAAKQDAAAAVPPPPSIHSTPTRMAQPHAVRVHVAMLGQVQTMFCAQLARFAIAQSQS